MTIEKSVWTQIVWGFKVNNKTLTFKEHLNKELLPYRIAVPLAFSVLAALVSAYLLLMFYSQNDQSFLNAISPHVSTLIETQDRPELQRFITSIGTEKNVEIDIVQNGEIIVSSHDNSKIGKSPKYLGLKLFGLEGALSLKHLISTVKIKRANGPTNNHGEIILSNPTTLLFFMIASLGLAVFICMFQIFNMFANQIIKTAQKSMEPIKDLQESIYSLTNFGEVNFNSDLKIEELENIYNAILKTNNQLKESNEKLAESKAKELTISAYQKLIHDLHVPVAALKQMIKVVYKEGVPEDKKEFAKTRIAEFAEQILFQIKTSKGNLKVEVDCKDFDLEDSIKKATGQAQMAMASYENIEVIEQYDPEIKNVAHDNMMLGRAISNLVVNAIEEAKSIVEVAVKRIGQEISITVSDDGKGEENDIISLFLQGRGKSNKKNGLGIGLSSANHIIRLHGGKIYFRQSHLGGACFDIRLQG